MKRNALLLVVVLSLVLAPSALAKPSWTDTRMVGLWITTDCATGGPLGTPSHTFDCGMPGPLSGIPGDASAMSLAIGAGSAPFVRFVDTYATYCVNNGMPQRYIATGYGIYTVPPETEARTMNVTFTQASCGDVAIDPPTEPAGLYFCCQENDPSSDSLWDDNPHDTDWGNVWERAQ